MIFRELNEEETQEFKKWARDNYIPMSEISKTWHPVVRNECLEINAERLYKKYIKPRL
tara:strand:- start:812 stop:985 length:174 start_codon:yes stop_codon:yes gene_type:complete